MEDALKDPDAAAALAAEVSAFYEAHPYPPPTDDLDAYRRIWDDRRRRAESHLLWPHEPYRRDRSILVAGCGTSQAAHYAVRWPQAQVVGIDVSAKSLAFSRKLKQKHHLANLELRQLSVERAGELARTFDHVVCTGVLHHLPDPDVGLASLRSVLAPSGALHLMVYAPYGRAGIYLIQDYCRRLGVSASHREIDALLASLKALPSDHPLAPLLRNSPDFADRAGIADALLHPRDRPYSVPEFIDYIGRAGLTFGRWVRQAPYLPWCGLPSSMPHAEKLVALEPEAQFAAMELFRGTMVRHAAIAYASTAAATAAAIDFDGDTWPGYIPVRLPDTLIVRDRNPPGAAAVLVNRNHTFTDLYLPIDARELALLEAIDGKRAIGALAVNDADLSVCRSFFQKLWRSDQVVFDTSHA